MIRKLNHNELNVLKSIYYNSVTYDKIRITNQHLFSKLLKKYSAIVFDNTIVFTERSYKDDFTSNIHSMSILVHEVCHVWQYQNLNYRWYKAGIEHINFGKSTYKYNIADFKHLTEFRYEQQGEIMADYYKFRYKNDPRVRQYENVIYSSINKT